MATTRATRRSGVERRYVAAAMARLRGTIRAAQQAISPTIAARARTTTAAVRRDTADSIPIACQRSSGGLVQRDLLPTGRGPRSPHRWPAIRRVRRAKDSLHYVALSRCNISIL